MNFEKVVNGYIGHIYLRAFYYSKTNEFMEIVYIYIYWLKLKGILAKFEQRVKI